MGHHAGTGPSTLHVEPEGNVFNVFNAAPHLGSVGELVPEAPQQLLSVPGQQPGVLKQAGMTCACLGLSVPVPVSALEQMNTSTWYISALGPAGRAVD